MPWAEKLSAWHIATRSGEKYSGVGLPPSGHKKASSGGSSLLLGEAGWSPDRYHLLSAWWEGELRIAGRDVLVHDLQ